MVQLYFFACTVFLPMTLSYRPVPQPRCVNQNEVSALVDPKSFKEKTCELRNLPQPPCKDQRNCESKCVCKDGYYRNYLGDCISGKECDKCRGENEFYSCNSACDNECSNLAQNRTNCPIKNIKCNEKCYCKDGFARDKKNKCVPVQHCPAPKCEANEEFVCKRSCPPEVCFAIIAFFNCDSEEPCQPKCACKPGYYRLEDDSPCIPSCQCPEMQGMPECKNKK